MKAIVLYVFRVILVPCLIAACAFAQPPTTGSVTGVVRINGTPAAGVLVSLSGGDSIAKSCETDAAGRYAFTDLIPGTVRVQVKSRSGLQSTKSLEVEPGINSVWHVSLAESVRITGRIRDENRAPLKGATVVLFFAEYSLGALKYIGASSVTTNDAGEYTVVAPPRDAFYVLARKPGHMPTYYPGAESIAGAAPIVVPLGGARDMIDVQMKAAPARCIEGKIETPPGEPPATFEISENDPPLWTAGRIPVGQRIPAGEDGKFRACDLHPGDYWIKTYSSSDPQRGHGIQFVTIGDKDVSGIVTGPQPPFPVDGVVSWDGGTGADSPSIDLNVGIASSIGEFGAANVALSGALPRRFALPVSNHGFVLNIEKVPAGAYVKDVTYGGRSILNEVFNPGSAPAADGLRIVLARDGARVSVKAADKDGKPMYDANVAIIPAMLTTEAAAASAMITAKTDANGAWTSGPIAPGKYIVIATTSPVNRSPEVFRKVWQARSSSDVVELTPNGSAQLTRIPAPIE